MSKKPLTVFSISSFLIVSLSIPMLWSAESNHQLITGVHLPFYVYHAFRSPDNHYSPSGWMGDYGDLRFDDHAKAQPTDIAQVIKVTYSAKGTQGAGWAGIYWQHPANNWGDREGGYNLNGASKLIFKARGENGGEAISEFKIGGIEGNFRDSGSAAIGPMTLTKDWKEYTIPLDGQELSSITGGFCLTMNRDNNPNGATVYLDNIRFE